MAHWHLFAFDCFRAKKKSDSKLLDRPRPHPPFWKNTIKKQKKNRGLPLPGDHPGEHRQLVHPPVRRVAPVPELPELPDAAAGVAVAGVADGLAVLDRLVLGARPQDRAVTCELRHHPVIPSHHHSFSK